MKVLCRTSEHDVGLNTPAQLIGKNRRLAPPRSNRREAVSRRIVMMDLRTSSPPDLRPSAPLPSPNRWSASISCGAEPSYIPESGGRSGPRESGRRGHGRVRSDNGGGIRPRTSGGAGLRPLAPAHSQASSEGGSPPDRGTPRARPSPSSGGTARPRSARSSNGTARARPHRPAAGRRGPVPSPDPGGSSPEDRPGHCA